MSRVLLVDDEPDFVAGARELLKLHGHEVVTAESLADARERLGAGAHEVLLLDLMLPDGNGLELLDELDSSSLRKVVLITGHPGIKSHVRHLAGPTLGYLTKPIDAKGLLQVAQIDEKPVRSSASRRDHFGLIVGEHESMHALYGQIEKIAPTNSPVLIIGETGTGKELVAQAIHRQSACSGDFVPVNCGSLSRDLAGSELFGHEKGSFTGAVRRHQGFFKRAESGTLFLDELTEMPIDLQPHLLRVLESGRVLPVGSEREVKIDARVVTATNRDPKRAIDERILREDLYFRLSVFPLTVPPLRQRSSDVALLAEYFLNEFSNGSDGPRFSAATLDRLRAYHWPGNVRELRHVVQRAFIMAPPDADELEIPGRFESPYDGNGAGRGLEAGRSIRDVERDLIEKTLEHFDGDKKAAAETLGISLNTLYNRLNSYQDVD
ncbi:MAG TPA: sigma-54 dependent transcriptional regulator [Gammaproteobacteria bacterium]|nr:sigma-54 dependent transcriptional regulator [Gammaproteobacteria bacterium]